MWLWFKCVSHWGEPHDSCSCNHRQHGHGEESTAKCFRFVPLVLRRRYLIPIWCNNGKRKMWPWRWLHHFEFQHWRWLHALMTMVAWFRAGNFDTHTADPLQTNMPIGCMIVVKCDTCKISGAYTHLDCITSTVGDIGNRHSMQVTHSYKERIFNLFPPQLKTNLWMIWHHQLKLPLSAKYSWFQGMVIREEQCAKFEAVPSIMHGSPQFDPVHEFKIGQEWRVERR